MFKELTDKLSYPEIEKQILAFWKENRIFEKSISTREGRLGFTFYEGPPTANGRPGIHHVMSRTLKDLVCRYKTMRGYQVHRKAGWDTHGLPVEIEVEKLLGFKHKDDIVKYGVAEFNKKCRESVWKYKADWEAMTEQMGYWVDMTKPYITFENDYIESVWWALKRFFDEGMIYRGYKIQPYCPRCETPLSSHEVSLGYQDVKDLSVYVKMKLKSQSDTSFLVWTTTPWTLISNVALAVSPKVDYVKVDNKGEKLILAEARLGVLEGEYTILERMKGKELSGLEYHPLFTYFPVDKKAHYVVEADFVTTEDGSGIVHMAPAYGEDDYQTSRKYGLPTIHPVNKSGEFGPEVTEFAGKFVKDADPLIIQNLKSRHILYKKETITHSYPHCWRCTTPLLYYARESWYISTTKYVQKMIALNKQINWVPPEVGEGRFGNWLEENKDWALSRDRFWGTPLPIWICEKCRKQKCVGSMEELRRGQNVQEPLDLHKPSVDAVTFTCACGGTMKRTPELIDVWFDSGAMSFAQWHYPFEHKERIESGEQYPADYICEGIDQTRGWFYSLHAIGTFLFNKPAYKNILVNELILDKDGQKMSKTKGNTVDPFTTLAKYGADTTRWYLVTTSPPWRPTMFDEDGLGEVQRKFFGTLVNTYSFFALYANIDGFTFSEPPVPVAERQEIDQWIISELNSLVRKYVACMDAYDVTRAARSVSEFTIDQLSNWYVRRNRRRFWKSEKGKDKTAAYQTLYECLDTVVKLTAPFAPFLSEELYCNLNTVSRRENNESVHLATSPELSELNIDPRLELKMELVQRVASVTRSLRNKTGINTRMPLKRIVVSTKNLDHKSVLQSTKEILKDEVNVKEIEFVDSNELVQPKAKPNYRELAKLFGPATGSAASYVSKRIDEVEERFLNWNGNPDYKIIDINISDEPIGTHARHYNVVFVPKLDLPTETIGDLTVSLDNNLTEELRQEGFAREFVNRIQNMRKDAGFQVTDRIAIFYRGSDTLHTAVKSMTGYIKSETLAIELSDMFSPGEYSEKLEVNGEEVEIGIERRSQR